MISVTDQAADQLEALRTANEAQADQGVKLVPDGSGGIGMTIDAATEGDEVVSREDTPILIVDGSISGLLDGAVLDCETAEVDGEARTRFTVRPAGQEAE